jgi:hypothetical protein
VDKEEEKVEEGNRWGEEEDTGSNRREVQQERVQEGGGPGTGVTKEKGYLEIQGKRQQMREHEAERSTPWLEREEERRYTYTHTHTYTHAHTHTHTHTHTGCGQCHWSRRRWHGG